MERTDFAKLTTLPGSPRAATEADMVAGVSAQVVVEPETEEAVADILRYASAEGLAVIPRGGATQLDYGAPPRRADIVLSMARLNGVIEHAPHDLTVTVRTGARLADLQLMLGETRQWLALDPPLAPGATIGGVIATSATGPRRQRYGGVRDQIIGVRVALADGMVARGGGKVVKNVAGYDLPKLYTGALGTLGVVLSASFRLYPVLPFSGSALVEAGALESLCALSLATIARPITPTIIDIFPATAAAPATLAIRFESAAREAISDQIEVVRRLASEAGFTARPLSGDEEIAWWRARDAWAAGAPTGDDAETLAIKASVLPSDTGQFLAALEEAGAASGATADVRWRAHAGIGLVEARVAAPPAAMAGWGVTIERLRAGAVARRGSVVVTRTPSALRGRVDPWGPVNGLEIMRSLKTRFDPQATLNPGRFVDGI
ncbi:MAG TPA: FAD-binding oxidoreductase [Ktedonobacterales bacterium]